MYGTEVSDGHICFHRDKEYFWAGGCLYYADTNNYLCAGTGVRVGARFVSTKENVDHFCYSYKTTVKDYIRFRTGDFDPDQPLFSTGD